MNINKVVISVVTFTLKCLAVFLIAFCLIQGGRKAYSFGYTVFVDEAMASKENAREVTVTITEGQSALEIGKMLQRIGLVRDANVFFVQTLLSEDGQNLKAGKYDLNTGMTADDIMETIASTDENTTAAGE